MDKICPQVESYTEAHKELSVVLLKIYTLADRLMVPRLKAAITSAMFILFLDPSEDEGGPSAFIELAVYASGNIPARSTVHQLLVDSFCSIGLWQDEMSGDDRNAHRQLPAEFKQRAFMGFMERRREDAEKSVAKLEKKVAQNELRRNGSGNKKSQARLRAAEKRIKETGKSRCYE